MASGPSAPPAGDAPPAGSPYQDEIVISWPELHRDARYLSRVLHELRQDWKGIIAITRGGLVPAALVARELELRLIDTVCVVSYGAGEGGAEQHQGELHWLKGVEGDGEGWLLIDDLVDTGRTARAVRERLPRAHFATLYAKPAGRPLVDTFVKEFKQEKWIYFPWDIDYQFVSPIKRSARP
jgi:xanthine phosphoribosyltransferase